MLSFVHDSNWSSTLEMLNSGPKIVDFSAQVTLRFDGGPWKTIGHLFYATWSFVHDFIAICEFKLELQSRNFRFGSKLAICPVWP